MEKIKITLVDGSQYSKMFETSGIKDQFLAKLELFEGLFIDFFAEEKKVIRQMVETKQHLGMKLLEIIQ